MTSNAILVIDDDKTIRLTLKKALESPETAVELAENGKVALEKLAVRKFFLVLLDMQLPDFEGLELLRVIAGNWPRVRIAIITAHATIDLAILAMKLGAVDFIRKPFAPEQLREAVQTISSREALCEDGNADFRSLIELAKRHVADKAFSEAARIAVKAIAREAGNPEGYYLLGVLNEIRGDLQEAQKFYRAALSFDPAHAAASANLHRITTWETHDVFNQGGYYVEPGEQGTGT